ncbi:MAG TPA: NAD-dependent epimerase/dehydratase family protein [Chryseolinea sp.]|nr:NAD-dependent epimerase/dehydratase family protein [Chryseolinea sp.]
MKAALVGAGDISHFHIQFLTEIKDLTIVGICDKDSGRAATVAAKYRIPRSYTDHRSMIEVEAPDVVHVLTPPMSHAQIAIDAMTRGCHTLVEKPLALEMEEAQRMVGVARETGKKLAVCEIYHYDPVIQKAKALLEKGIIGDLIHVENYWFADVRGSTNAYAKKGGGTGWAYSLPGSVFANFIDHPVYLQREFVGDITEVQTNSFMFGDNPFVPYDELRITLLGKNRMGNIVASLNGKPRMNILRLYGTEGIITADMANLSLTVARNRGIPSFLQKGVHNFSNSYELVRDTIVTTAAILKKSIKPRQGLRTLIKTYYDCIRIPDSGIFDKCPCNAERALGTVNILKKIWEANAAERTRGSGRSGVRIETPKTFEHVAATEKGKCVLVTGASGFLGFHLVEELLKKGYLVRVITRRIMKKIEGEPNLEIVYGDIRDPECVRMAVEGVHTIYHCASITTNKGSWHDFEETIINGTRYLLNAAVEHGVQKFLYVSTVAVYGFEYHNGQDFVSEDGGYGKNLSEFYYYPKSKIEAEKLVLETHRTKNLPVVIIRPGLIFGPGGRNIFKKNKILISAKNNILPYIYVKNVVDAMILSADNDIAIGKVYNVVGDEHITQGDFQKRTTLVSGNHGMKIFMPRPALFALAKVVQFLFGRISPGQSPPFGDYHYRTLVRNLKYDNSKIKAELGWRPTVSIDEGITATFKYRVNEKMREK